MRKPQISPEQAIDEAVAMLRAGPDAPPEAEVREVILKEVEAAKKAEQWERLGSEHTAALASIQKAAAALWHGLEALRGLDPWAHDDETGEKSPMYQVLPVEDPQQLEVDLRALSTMGDGPKNEVEALHRGVRRWKVKNGPWAGRSIRLQLPAKIQTRPRLPGPVLDLHQAAVTHLKQCGLNPSVGTGGNIAKLGGLYCAAAVIELKSGESTKAARLARSPRERMPYQWGGKVVLHEVDGLGKPIIITKGPYELMWPICQILPKLE